MKPRLAALALLALCAGAAWLDAHAPAAAAARSREPAWGLAALRYAGQPDVVPPALYLLLHTPARGTLDAVLLPPGTPLSAQGKPRTLADVYGDALRGRAGAEAAGRAMAEAGAALLRAAPGWPAGRAQPLFTASLTLPAASRPGSPAEVRRGLAASAADPVLWLRAPRLWARAARGAGAPGPWDAAVLTRALRSVPEEGVRAARWPAPELAGPFAAWLLTGAAPQDPRHVVTVEVLNASGRPGVALRATKVLRWAGFDVVHFGNAAAPEAATSAVDRVGRPEAARAALSALGCRRAETLTAFEPGPLTMVSLTVGRDAEGCARLAGTREED